MKKSTSLSISILLLLTLIFAAGIFGVNSLTADIIEANSTAAEYAPLMAVIPGAEGFDVLYDIKDAASSKLRNVPETVKGIYAETSGLGYALKLSTNEGYTGEPIELSLGVDSEGRISGLEINAYPDSKELSADYPSSYIGQDSALADVGLVSGVTFSSSAFKNAVADGFEALTSNSLVSAGVKSDSQLLMELAGQLYSGIVNPSGTLQYEELEATGSISEAYKALNGSGVAALIPYENGSCLAVVNLSGDILAVDTKGNEISDKLDPALIEEVKKLASENLSSFADKDLKRLKRMLSDGAELSPIELKGIFSTITSAFSINDGGQKYLGLVSRSYGYSNEIMTIYAILDSEGRIYAINTPDLILHKEYFDGYTLDEASYKEGFKGIGESDFTGDQALISGATMSSDAMKAAVNDFFAAFKILSEGGALGNE